MELQAILDHAFEIGISIFLAVLGWSFGNWSTAIKDSSEKIMRRLDDLYKEFHEHKLHVEHRVTKVEAKVDKDG